MPIVPANYVPSKKTYALKPASFRFSHRGVTNRGTDMYRYTVDAIWFAKRGNGRMAAFFGVISDLGVIGEHPGSEADGKWNYQDFLIQYSSARYGGTPLGCWDGAGTWWSGAYAGEYNLQQEKLPFLQELLEARPDIPEGYEGWFSLTER